MAIRVVQYGEAFRVPRSPVHLVKEHRAYPVPGMLCVVACLDVCMGCVVLQAMLQVVQ